MRFADIRPLAVSLISGGALTLGLISAGLGLPAAAAAATSQCEPLPVPASPSPAASPSAQAELCVTVQASAASVKPGQAASYTVQVAAENGPASGVSVTLTAAPQGQTATFTSRCPSGNGTAACSIGSVGGTVSPSSYQMQAQIKVASGATSVTSVTLTATADAATSPAMTAMPAASGTTAVTAATPSPSKSSTPAATTSAAQVSSVTPPALASPPALGSMPAGPGASTSLISPVSVASALPVITPLATPGTVGPASPAAETGTPAAAGNFTVVIGMSAATAQLLGLVGLGLVLLLAATKLVGDQLTARRNQKKEAGTKTKKNREAGRKRLAFRSSVRLLRRGHRRVASRPGSQPTQDSQDSRPGLPAT